MAYERIYRLSLFSFFVSLIAGIGSAISTACESISANFLGLGSISARETIELDRAGRELSAIPLSIASSFKAFVSRALDHDEYRAGRFDVGELSSAL